MSRLIFILVAISVTFFLSEFALRIIDYPESVEYGWGRDNNMTHSYSDSDYVIVLLGDSQVRNRGGDSGAPLPGEILEQLLNSFAFTKCFSSKNRNAFKVVTIGSGGWGQDQQLLALREYFDAHRADLVILWETPENDIWNNAFPTHYPLNGTPKPTFVLDRTGNIFLAPKSEIIPYWLELKTGVLTLKAFQQFSQLLPINRDGSENSVTGNAHQRKLWNPDRYWDKYLPPVKNFSDEESLVDGSEYLASFNPYVSRDPINLEKTHFAIGLNDGSNRLNWMARLTNLLLKETRQVSVESGAHFFTFSYDASSTDQPLYPPDGYYLFGDHRFDFSESVMKRRLSIIHQGINHYSISLAIRKWRKGRNNPHLNKAANKSLVTSLLDIVINEICDPEVGIHTHR